MPQLESFGNFRSTPPSHCPGSGPGASWPKFAAPTTRTPPNRPPRRQLPREVKGPPKGCAAGPVSPSDGHFGGTDNVDGNVVSLKVQEGDFEQPRKRTESASTAGAEKNKEERKPKTNYYADFWSTAKHCRTEDDYNRRRQVLRFPMNYDSDMDFDEIPTARSSVLSTNSSRRNAIRISKT